MSHFYPAYQRQIKKPKRHEKKSNIVGAGGVIYDPRKNAILVVQGHMKWSLPKGHCERGEAWNETAMREIFEETTLSIRIERDHYWKKINKYIYYYILLSNGTQVEPRPGDPAEINAVEWMTRDQLLEIYSNCNKQLQYIIDKWSSMAYIFTTRGEQLIKFAK